ncbi:NAD regulator [Pseudahrensia aquimaris]|uniref:NAD regulator n=1 Tax=Pseudahrensia aquimaris TaxID=744461 RepID=A0ABW3FBA6_9HYPH
MTMDERSPRIEIGLHAAVVAVEERTPLVLINSPEGNEAALPALPFGPFDPDQNPTMEAGLRRWVGEQTLLPLGYVEQLYTFGDRRRMRAEGGGRTHLVSVGYLALVRKKSGNQGQNWTSWYAHFPWEDWREGEPSMLREVILPALRRWIDATGENSALKAARSGRVQLAFGCELHHNKEVDLKNWDEERVLERYELAYEAALVQESVADGHSDTLALPTALGRAMLHDHRRILATAMARLRGKLKYRPVVFELLAEQFTLTELQQTVEALSGRRLHKQNFRRMVDKAGLVEATGATTSRTGGRPAAYFRFRRSVTRERPVPGLRVGSSI